MQALSWTSIGFYCVFSTFVFYQQRHIKNFQGASQVFSLLLNVSALLGMLTGMAYLIYYGYSIAWWAPLVALVAGFASTIIAYAVERLVGELTLSLGGFVGWPASAYLMFRYLPTHV